MLAIISDIHGNYPALKAVLDDINDYNCTEIISLGDVAGYYCMLNECIDALKEKQVLHIRGNHDYYLINNILSGRSRSADRCILYQRSIVTDGNLDWLKLSVDSHRINNMSFVHGGWKDNLEEYLYNISSQYFEKLDGEFFFSGHSHVQFIKNFGKKLYCNPGSVGQPRDGDNRAAYALIHKDGFIQLRRVQYDINLIAGKMEDAGFEPYFYKNLYHGTRLDGGLSSIQVSEVEYE
ncbi:metallophosphoesterase family protein [Paenibacillus favisporus]|uniref:metallophosphoesterase family protein n=1 Tax=Paenibacillus favisporus TaxID=221028 RepID=UPI003D27AD96